MEKKKPALGNAAASAGKAASGFFIKAKESFVNSVDQNGDGKLGLDDVSAVTDSVKAAVKESNDRWNERQAQKKREKEMESLRPLFEEDTDNPDFSLPKLIRIAEMDDNHRKSSLCQNSIGFIFPAKEMDIITLYPEKVNLFGLRFHPDMESEMYYVDPTDRDFYIALDDYFNYLKIARIGELEKIAQDLGAKHFRVTYKEQKRSLAENDIKGRVNVKAAVKQGADIEAEHQRREKLFSSVEIAAEMSFIGHAPRKPMLKYFKKDPQIQNLVEMRMSDNPVTHQVYTLNLAKSSGIKEKDATKIDASLNAMKISGKATVTSEAQKEMQRLFEYEIDF